MDKFENSTIQKEFFAPLGAAAFEVSWNNAPFAFDFDYGATFLGFLAYKFALTTVLYETVRSMLITDSESFYDTSEKKYTDPNDWTDEIFVKFNADEPIHEPHEQPAGGNAD